jgi:hypothetical protein
VAKQIAYEDPAARSGPGSKRSNPQMVNYDETDEDGHERAIEEIRLEAKSVRRKRERLEADNKLTLVDGKWKGQKQLQANPKPHSRDRISGLVRKPTFLFIFTRLLCRIFFYAVFFI